MVLAAGGRQNLPHGTKTHFGEANGAGPTMTRIALAAPGVAEQVANVERAAEVLSRSED